MSAGVVKWNEAILAARLRNRRRWRVVLFAGLGILLASSLFDHLRAQNRGGDDWHRFDGKQAGFVEAFDGQTIGVREDNSDAVTPVRLIGVASFSSQWDREAKDRLNSLLAGRVLIFHLEPTQTRDEKGELLAYIITEDGEPVNSQIVKEGLGLADRRVKFAFDAAVDQAETQASRKHAGLWATANSKAMPAWRSKWYEQKLHQYSNKLQ